MRDVDLATTDDLCETYSPIRTWLNIGPNNLSTFWILSCVDLPLEPTESRWVVALRIIIVCANILAILKLHTIAETENTIGDDVAFIVSLFHILEVTRPFSLTNVPAELVDALVFSHAIIKTSFGKLGHRQRGAAYPPRTNHKANEINQTKNSPKR